MIIRWHCCTNSAKLSFPLYHNLNAEQFICDQVDTSSIRSAAEGLFVLGYTAGVEATADFQASQGQLRLSVV